MSASDTANATSARSERIWSLPFAVAIVAAIATTFLLESTRIFLAYTLFIVDQSERTELALNAGGTFAAIALGGIVLLVLRARGAVALAIALLVTSRLIFQFTDDPDWRRYTGALAVVAWGWLLPALRSIHAEETARGVVFGLLLDLGLRFVLGTIDLPWMPDATRHTITLVLTVILLAAVIPVLIAGRGQESAAGPSLVGVGPGLALFHLAFGNLGIAQVKASLAIEVVIWLLAIGIASGFLLQIRPPAAKHGRPAPSGWANAAAMTVLGLLALLVFWRWDGVFDIAAVLMAGIGAMLILLSVRGRADLAPSIFGDSLWLTLGLLIHAGLIFTYYAETGFPILIGIALVLLGIGGALSTKRGGDLPTLSARPHAVPMLGLAAVLILLGLFANRDFWGGIDRDDSLGRELTVMTYNLQTGFSRDNVWDLEAQASLIEQYDPDIVILQEVSRGWIITSGADQVRWLSHRLDMEMAWGPSAQDELWGVAILAKADITASEMRMFDTTTNLRRGVVGAVVPIDGGQLWVYGTHLDNPGDAEGTRIAQATQLISIADGTPGIVGGDFNAQPDSDTIQAMLAAGFIDTGAGPNLPTSENDNRIDYIFARGPFQVVEAITPQVWASDHRPFVARLLLE